MTRVSKRKVDRGEREDRERRNYPPPPPTSIDGAIQTPAERNPPAATSTIRRFFHTRAGSAKEVRRSIRKVVEV
jgi:hypothetical protein